MSIAIENKHSECKASRRFTTPIVKTAHNWEEYQKKDVFDDGTVTYFWRAHTLTVLFFLTCILVYVALFEETIEDSLYNLKRGIIACILVFILLGVTQTPDGPFQRPHPALWRFVFCVSIVYELFLIFVIFQTVDDARQLLRHFDPKLGTSQEEKGYGGDCTLFDWGSPQGVLHNVWDKMDVFVPTHFFGWWIKTLILRDWWLCSVISIMFEVLEYTLEHQLPNFSECWWDHWILDALVCNGLGIYLGMKTLRYFSMKPYHWRGVWNIPSYRGKLKRFFAQFGPHSWVEFDWKATASLNRWLATLGTIAVFLLAELNTFYLKYILWVPPSHYLNLIRVCIYLLAGAVSMRETFQYLDDPTFNKFGRQSWVVLAIIITEFFIIAKFDWNTITKPLPKHITILWIVGLVALFAWTIWNFFLRTKIDEREDNGIHSYANVVTRKSRSSKSSSHRKSEIKDGVYTSLYKRKSSGQRIS